MQTNLSQHLAQVQIRGDIKFLMIKESTGKQVRLAADIHNYMRAESRINRECCWVIHLDGRNQIIQKELVSMGTVTASLVAPREVFRRAIIQGSAAIIVVHNHPSGNSEPSMADIEVCTNLLKAAEIINIKLLDFMVIGFDEYTSFADANVGGFK
ncbi:MAG: JAB domain-containing protein [Halobacteriota archaeon]